MIFSENNARIVKRLKPHKSNSFIRLLKLTAPYLNKVILAAICVLLLNLVQVIKPYILKYVIDDFLMKHVTHQGIFSIQSMGAIYLIIAFLGSVLAIAQVNLINRAGQEIMKGIRRKVFNTIQYLPLNYLDKTSSGRLITRATNDVEAISEMYTDIVISMFQDFFLLLGIIYAMLSLNVKLALVSFSVLPIMVLIILVLKNKMKKVFLDMKALIGRINGFMAENISGMRVIQMFRAEKEKYKEFLKLNDEYFKVTLVQVQLNSILRPGTVFFQNLTVVILLWYGMNKIGNHSIQLGVIYAFTTYIKQFFDPISDLSDQYTSIQSALVSADRIFGLLDEVDNKLEDLN